MGENAIQTFRPSFNSIWIVVYPPKHHQTKDKEKMLSVVKNYPLAILVSAKEEKHYAIHIPIIYNETSKKLVAHIDKNNPQVDSLIDGAQATAIFKGPDTYISPSIYSTKQLPTWNYIIVHLSGVIKRIKNALEAKRSIVEMTQFLEGKVPRFELELEDPRMDRLVPYIQAFEIEITHWDGKFKLSQDKNDIDYERAKNQLMGNRSEPEKTFIETIYDSLK